MLNQLNVVAGSKDNDYVIKYAKEALDKFEDGLVGVELGSAYGGNVEEIATMWKHTGVFYGFDTFEGHPAHLAEDIHSFEASCMDYWYKDDVLGRDKLDYDYQRKVLDDQGLHNAVLVKGIVDEHSLDFLPKIHYAFLDMDIKKSMTDGYEAVKDRIVKGVYLLLHDVIDEDHIPALNKLFKETIMGRDKDMWKEVDRSKHFLVVLERI